MQEKKKRIGKNTVLISTLVIITVLGVVFLTGHLGQQAQSTETTTAINKTQPAVGTILQTAKPTIYSIESSQSIYSRNLASDVSSINICKELPRKSTPKFILSEYSVYDEQNGQISWSSSNCYIGGVYVGENLNYIYCISESRCDKKIENNINKGYESFRIKTGYEMKSQTSWIKKFTAGGTEYNSSYTNVTTNLAGCAIEYKLYDNIIECSTYGEQK